jgi:hypothetical protein
VIALVELEIIKIATGKTGENRVNISAVITHQAFELGRRLLLSRGSDLKARGHGN